MRGAQQLKLLRQIVSDHVAIPALGRGLENVADERQ
jgi:hypothetical protein